MIDVILIGLMILVIGVKVLTTVSTKFRRWLYKDVI